MGRKSSEPPPEFFAKYKEGDYVWSVDFGDLVGGTIVLINTEQDFFNSAGEYIFSYTIEQEGDIQEVNEDNIFESFEALIEYLKYRKEQIENYKPLDK